VETAIYKHAWYVRYTYFLIRAVLGPIVKVIWIKSYSGLSNIPKKGAAIIAFNHQSYFDFICFIAICPRLVHFLSAEKFFDHHMWKHLMRLTGQIKVHRKEHDKHILHATVHDHLTNGKIVGIFPEGTRSADPIEMLHAFTGVAKYAIRGRVPVIPVGISGAHEVMSRSDKRPRFLKNIRFEIGKPIHFKDHYDKELSEMNYRQMTDVIMLEISRLSGKKYSYVGLIERKKHD